MSILHRVEDYDVHEGNMDTPLPLGPAGVLHGQLSNGYYVRTCKKPQARAALQLAIRVGSIVEEEHERGVAHILEHLAFNASEAYSNHKVVEVLESLGSAFGPCQNAYTGVEETLYELVVPTDDATIMAQALAVLREFAFKIRIDPEDLEKERGPVLEEWRAGRDAHGRAQEAHWELMLRGSQYARRLPIGLESVIRDVSAPTVRAFYERWYHPAHMAVIAVGDFENPEEIVTLIKSQLGVDGLDRPPPTPLPSYPWMPHTDLHCRVLADKENPQTCVYINFKSDSNPLETLRDYLDHMKESLLHTIVNSRLFKVCRKADTPFYSAMLSSDAVIRSCTTRHVTVTPLEGRTVDAIEGVLLELARVRLYGITQRELDIAKAEYLMQVEAMYLERDQGYANDLAEEYVRHFLSREMVVGEELEARLSKTLVKRISVDDLLPLCEHYRSTSSCVIKVIEYPAKTTVEQVTAAVSRVDAAEAVGEVEAWSQEDTPEHLLEAEPEAGEIVSTRDLPALGAKELLLSNGMRVTYKCFKALEDQVLFTGFAPGGLSEVPRDMFRTAGFASMLAGELGMFGFKPHVLSDILAGKRVEIKPSEGAFWRQISGEQSPHDLETALQLLYCLFTHQVDAVESELKSMLLMARQMVEAQLRNPLTKFTNHVRYLNYGRCYYFTPIVLSDLDRLDVHAACRHFTRAYQNPAEFTLCFAGNIDESVFLDLARRYLASIPRREDPVPKDLSAVTQIPFKFPERPVVAAVEVDMVEPVAQVQLTFPIQVDGPSAPEDGMWSSLVCKLLEQRLLRKMRFEGGQLYSCSVSPFFSCEAPSRVGPFRGDIAVSFSCHPGRGRELAHLALRETLTLQEDGPTADEVTTVLNLEQRSYENEVQENAYWLEMLASAYQSRRFAQLRDADEVYKLRVAARASMRAKAAPATFRDAMRRLLPQPCTKCYTIVTTTPPTVLSRALRLLREHRVAGCVLVGAVAAGVWAVLRSLHRAR